LSFGEFEQMETAMSRRTRRLISLAIGAAIAAIAAILVWLPAAAQAGITVTGLE
jgi:alkylhydroperoxidase/carboxymuconolactone decarboxylase family protein YurZ